VSIDSLGQVFALPADVEAERLRAVEHLYLFVELAAWAQRKPQRTDELVCATIVQRQLLPPALGDLPGYSVFTLCLPAYVVGGDFYDHDPIQDGMIFTVADVMGKGLGAAILTATVRAALRAASQSVESYCSAGDLDDAVNTASVQIVEGHGIAAVIRLDGTVERLNSNGLPLGVLPGDRWTAHDIRLHPGDTLVIASDGVLDLVGFGDDVRAAMAFVAQHADPADLCDKAHALQRRQPPLDDVTTVTIRRELPT